MADDLTVRANWFTRLLRGVGLLPSGQVQHVAGADFATTSPGNRNYDANSAMSAFAAFPWVQAAVNAISSDLSGLPLRAIKGYGSKAEVLDDHPMLQILRQPSSRVSGLTFRRQMILDLVLTGDAFAVIVGEREPLGLLRLHPQRTRVVPMPDGQPECVEYSGQGTAIKYAWNEILHVRTSSWSDDPSSLYGSGAIEALHHDLSTDYAASKMAAETAKIGRPTGVFSPASEGDYWTQDQIRVLREAYDKSMDSRSGALFLGGAAKFEALGWSPRDMEFGELRKSVREAVLATLDVPPSRVGLPNANYATSLNQSRRYWEGLRGRAALIDGELSRVARMFGDDSVRIEHDFSNVEALQESRTERLNRVQSWWMMGIPLDKAAEIEGFDLPEFESIEDESPEEERAAPGMVKLFVNNVADYTHPITEDARAAVWRSFRDRLHGPSERRLAIEMRKFLNAQAKRYAKRMAEILNQKSVKRGLNETEFRKILAEAEEAAELRKFSKRRLQLSMIAAFKEASKLIPGERLVFDPVRIDRAVDAHMAELVQNVQKTTKASIRQVITRGLDEGLSIQQMQANLMADQAFSAARAARIARTETTRSVNAGAMQAYSQAADDGLNIKVEWLTARDGSERHPSDPGKDGSGLDEQRIEIGGTFVLGDGTSGPGPGQMGVPEHDINCRCTVIPWIED